MPLTDETIADVEAFSVPELAVEFTDTLCRVWAQERDKYVTMPFLEMPTLYRCLDSLASVVLEDFEP